MYAFLHLPTDIKDCSMDGLFNEQLTEIPTILDCFIYQLLNTTSTTWAGG